MAWLDARHLFLLAVICYGLSTLYSVFIWRHGFRQDNRVNYGLILLGFVFHTLAMLRRGFSVSQCPIYNLYEATGFVMWTAVATYLLMGVWRRLRFLGAFVSPVLFALGVFALMPTLDPPHTDRLVLSGAGPSLHAAVSLLSYGAFSLSAVAGLMYLVQERDLKLHRLRALVSLMPPITRLEQVATRMLVAGFVLLTLGLLSGVPGLKHLSGHNSLGDPKIIWSAVVWLLYAGLILMRWRFAQRGRRFALGSIGAFAFVLLTFWGTNLLSPIHHPAAMP